MDYNEHNNEAESLFATKRKQQQAEEAERKRLEELEQQKKQMAEQIKRLEALQAAQREQEARRALEAQREQEARMAREAQLAQQKQEEPGTGAAPTGEKKGLDPKKKKIILIGALAALAVVALAVVLILVLGSKEPSEASAEDLEKYVEPYYGMWKYDEYENRYEIKEDGTWSIYVEEMGMVHAGSYDWEDGRLALTFDDGSFLTYLSLDTDDRLYDDDGNSLSRYGGSSTSWFEDHGIYVNYHYGDPAKTVSSGFSFEDKNNHSYARIPAEWTVEQSSRQSTGDGSCVITLVATLTTDGNNVPAFAINGSYWYNYNIIFCDYYTGLYLPGAKEDTLYSYTYSYEANGELVHVEFSYTADTSRTEDDSYTIVVTATVRMPEDYDGLVIACTDTARTLEIYEEQWAKVMVYKAVCPLDEFTDWQDFASGLICKINE